MNTYMLYYVSDVWTMPVVIERAEAVRLRLGLRQSDVANAIGVTQGHYSKLVNRRTPLAHGLAKRLDAWVDSNSAPDEAQADTLTHRIAALADSIQRQCTELLQLTALRRSGRVTSSESDSTKP